jgi:hypothetical protein
MFKSMLETEQWWVRPALSVMLLALLVWASAASAAAQSTDATPVITETQTLTETESISADDAYDEEGTAIKDVAAEDVAPPVEDDEELSAALQGLLLPLDRLCIEGSVINFDERPLTDGWVITANPLNSTSSPLQTVSDANGNFRFELGPRDIGLWELVKSRKRGFGSVTPDRFIVEITYGRHECVKVRFKQRPEIEVIVIKLDDNYLPQRGWVIRAEPSAGNPFGSATHATTGANGRALFRLTPGQWRFSEHAPAGVVYIPVIPPSGVYEINVTAPGPHTIYFKNRIYPGNGCIRVRKFDVPPNNPTLPLPGWLIEVRRADGSVAASGRTQIDGTIHFGDLPPGPYRVSEEQRVGWVPVTPTVVEVQVIGDPSCVRVTFLNIQEPPRFCIEGRKIDTNGKVGLPGWRIHFNPLDAGGYKPDDAVTDGEGRFTVILPDHDYRIPGARYQVCEEVQPGWLPHTPTCFNVSVPKEPGVCVRVPDFENQQKGHGVTPPKPIPPPVGCRHTHAVKRGEGLYAIGAKYGVGAQAMLNANPWVRHRPHYHLRVGDKVCIP